MAVLSLKGHMERQHGRIPPYTREVEVGGWGSVTYVVSFPWVLKTVVCQVTGCPTVAHSTGRLGENFMYINFFLRIAVVQEGREPLPLCNLCGMHMPVGCLIKHQRKQRCNRNTHIR